MSNKARIRVEMEKVIAFSGGVESTTMCVLFGGSADAVFADTGFEHDEMYTRIEQVEQAIRIIHGNDFTVHRVQSERGSLEEYIREQKYYPSFRTRFCTRMFKIEPVDTFLESISDKESPVELMIGLNADEADRRVGNLGKLDHVEYTYPLVENGLTRSACIDILERVGLQPTFPPYMLRGGCVGCFYKSKKEYALMHELAPDQYARVEDLEKEIQDERGKFYTVISNMKGGLKGFRQRLESQGKLFEIAPDSGAQTQCGIFCNR